MQGPWRADALGLAQASGLPAEARGTCLAGIPAPAPRCCRVKVSGQGFLTSFPRYARRTVRLFPAYNSGAFSVRSGVTTISIHNMVITPERRNQDTEPSLP